MSYFKYQWHLFLTAMGFFSRIPCRTEYRKESQNRCIRYFPMVGWVVGVIGAAVFLLASWLLPVSVSVILSMAATILATGAFHEDGFADVCDSFGGGWSKEKILLIMKDSRVGAYGVIGVILMLLCKFLVINELNISLIAVAMIVAHILSRSIASTTMFTLEYVRDDETSKSKSLTKNIRFKDIAISLITGVLSIMLLPSYWYFVVLVPLFVVKFWMERWFVKWIGGYTGDCLGTIQQVCELVIYITILAVSRKVGVDDFTGLIGVMKGLAGQ
jgi:adenosylcobinamide-GDP ribazoletransferase